MKCKPNVSTFTKLLLDFNESIDDSEVYQKKHLYLKVVILYLTVCQSSKGSWIIDKGGDPLSRYSIPDRPRRLMCPVQSETLVSRRVTVRPMTWVSTVSSVDVRSPTSGYNLGGSRQELTSVQTRCLPIALSSKITSKIIPDPPTRNQ